LGTGPGAGARLRRPGQLPAALGRFPGPANHAGRRHCRSQNTNCDKTVHNAKEAPEPWTPDRSGDHARPCASYWKELCRAAPLRAARRHIRNAQPMAGAFPPGCTGHRRIGSLNAMRIVPCS